MVDRHIKCMDSAVDVSDRQFRIIFQILFKPGLFGKTVPAAAQAAAQMGVDLTALTWGRYFPGNMLPVTLGNLLGGLLVGAGAWCCHLRRAK